MTRTRDEVKMYCAKAYPYTGSDPVDHSSAQRIRVCRADPIHASLRVLRAGGRVLDWGWT